MSDSPYAHNLVSTLYSMKSLLESFLFNEPSAGQNNLEGILDPSHEVLKRAYHQVDQALQMARRIKEAFHLNGQSPGLNRAGKTEIQCSWQKAVQILRREFSFDGVQILNRIPESFPPIRCDSGDFEEILYHLLKNSLQAMDAKGMLIIRAQLSRGLEEEPLATIQVIDTGAGISRPQLSRIFHPFYSTKATAGGEGLGLFVTRQLVVKNGGEIIASSFTGSGTTFSLEFPLVAGEERESDRLPIS